MTSNNSCNCVLRIFCSAISINMKRTCILLLVLGSCLATDSTTHKKVNISDDNITFKTIVYSKHF